MKHEQNQILYRLQEIQKEIHELQSFRSILQLRGFIERRDKWILPSIKVETQITSTAFVFRWENKDVKQIQIPDALKVSIIHMCDEKIQALEDEFDIITTGKTRN